MNPTFALELHDVETMARTLDADGFESEAAAVPAVARLDGRELLIGEPALEGARFLPLQVNDRFYEALGEETLGRPFPASWRTADLAHAHLAETWRRCQNSQPERAGAEATVILITGGIDEHRLPLLLGVAKAAGLSVGGVLPSGLAATAALDLPESVVYAELYRHKAVATHLRRRGESIDVEDSAADPEISFTRLRAAQLKATARAFLRETRYDPTATAEGEQQLYDRLPTWLAALETHPQIDARLGHGGSIAAIELSRAELSEAATATADGLARLASEIKPSTGTKTVLLGARASSLGVSHLLQRAGFDVISLGAEAPCRGALAARRDILDAGPAIFLHSLRRV